MIFQMDFEIDKQNPNYENEVYNRFCANYINQIRDKLNFEKENLTIDDPREINKTDKKAKKIDIIRFKMEMVYVKTKVKKEKLERNAKPSIDNSNIEMEVNTDV